MTNPEYPKSLAEALTMIKANRWATIEQMATWAGVNPSTVYGWMEIGGADPHWPSLHRIYRLAGDERISMGLAHVFLAGGPAVPMAHGILPGPATIEGIKSGLIKTQITGAELTNRIITALADGTITAAEMVEIRQALDADTQAKLESHRDVEAKLEADAKKKITGMRLHTG